jgi:8-oxo-dGTP pyrophosphatase MutT (NUDIX family)
MAMSPYLRELRAKVGKAKLLIPSVSAHIFDSAGRLLLVKQVDGEVWSTPGGSIEPDESPSDAVVREVLEETGLIVRPRRLTAAYGGSEFVVHYPNGDETQYVIIGYECEVTGGKIVGETDETVDARYFSLEEAKGVELAPWLRGVIAELYST